MDSTPYLKKDTGESIPLQPDSGTVFPYYMVRKLEILHLTPTLDNHVYLFLRVNFTHSLTLFCVTQESLTGVTPCKRCEDSQPHLFKRRMHYKAELIKRKVRAVLF